MSLGTLLVAFWGVLVCVSQYFLKWIVFTHTGLVVVGVIGLIGFVLWILTGPEGPHPITVWKRPQ